jgi:hypothetical protein
VIDAFWTLTYADRRAFVNTLASMRRRPWLALLWILWISVIVSFAWLRTHGPRQQGIPFWQLALQDVWVCGAGIVFGLLLAFGTAKYVGFFSSRAEALMLIRSPLPPAAVAAYLQVRAVSVTLLQTFGRFAYILLIAFPGRTTLPGLLREGLLLAAGTTAIACIPLPRALATGISRIFCVATGTAVMFISALPLIRDALVSFGAGTAAFGLIDFLPDWHPGAAISHVSSGNLLPIALAVSVALAATLSFVLTARDAYPELYALSLAHLELRERIVSRRSARSESVPGDGTKTSVASSAAPVRGAFALVWLDAITWSRRAAPLMTVLLITGALLGGFAIGYVARSPEYGLGAKTLFGVLPNVYIGIASTGGVRLAADLRRPLFWLGGVPLGSRLAAWCCAPLWRDAVFVGLLALGFGVISGDVETSLAVLCGGTAIAMLSRAGGIAIFALLPNALEQRGPALFLRLMLSYMLVVPVGVVGIIVAVLTRSVLTGVIASLVPTLIETALLLMFGAWRLAGRVDRLSLA